MCLICLDLKNNHITVQEARNILKEVGAEMRKEDPEHLLELDELLKENREYDDT